MLYQSLRFSNGIWVMAELKMIPNGTSVSVSIVWQYLNRPGGTTLQGHDTSRALFYQAKGALPEHKKGSSLFIAKPWGHVPPPPVPTSLDKDIYHVKYSIKTTLINVKD